MTVVREMTDADVDAVAAVHVRTWQAAYAGIIPAAYLAGLDVAVAAERRRQPGPPGARTLVAVEGTEVVGFVAFGPGRETGDGELYAIYVDPARWDTGTGRLLFDAARAGLAAAGSRVMRLWVLEDNHRARRFYERCGMAPDGARQTWTPRGTGTELPEVRYAAAL